MALYLNLYHEIQNQKLKRQRDPLKIAIAGMLLIAVGFIAYYFWRAESVKHLVSRAAATEGEWTSKVEPQAKETDAKREEYEQNIKASDAIIHKIENRFYWAPLLEQILQVVPPEVQINDLDGSLSSDGSKKITLTIAGIATGSQPRAVAEDLRTTLQTKLGAQYRQTTSVFRSLDDGTEMVPYQGKNSPTVIFVIDVSFTSPDINEATKTPPARK